MTICRKCQLKHARHTVNDPTRDQRTGHGQRLLTNCRAAIRHPCGGEAFVHWHIFHMLAVSYPSKQNSCGNASGAASACGGDDLRWLFAPVTAAHSSGNHSQPLALASGMPSIGDNGDMARTHRVAIVSIRLRKRRSCSLLEASATKTGPTASRKPPSVCRGDGHAICWRHWRQSEAVSCRECHHPFAGCVADYALRGQMTGNVAGSTFRGRLHGEWPLARPQKVPVPCANGQPRVMLGDAGLTPASPSREWPAPR